MSSHTQGPWILDGSEITTKKDPANLLCHVYACDRPDNPDGNWEFGDTSSANAILISAAPELLETLKSCADWLDWLDDPRCGLGDTHKKVISAARAAISKAEGVKK